MDNSKEETVQETHITPQNIMKIGMGFQTSKILLSAVKKSLFTMLAQSPMTGDQISDFGCYKIKQASGL